MKLPHPFLATLGSMMLCGFAYAVPDHPRLLVSADDWEKLPARMAADPVVKEIIDTCIARAKQTLGENNLTYKLEGRRLLAVSRQAIQRVLDLSAAWKVTHDRNYLNRCRDELLNLSGLQDWHPSHHLDTAEMATAVAIGYDWLYQDLSPSDRKTIASALREKGLVSSIADKNARSGTNNWNQVCNGGLILSAVALADLEPQLSEQAIQEAIHLIPRALKEGYPQDGAYSEGANYWEYGTIYTVISVEALTHAGYANPGVARHPGFMASGRYIAELYGTSGLVFNYGDCSERSSIKPSPSASWIARETRSADLRNFLLPAFRDISPIKTDRFLALAAFWFPAPADVIAAPLPLHFLGSGNSPIAILRSGFASSDIFLGIKAGMAGVSHGHMDAGSFVLDILGQRWASDLGMQDYYSLEKRGIGLFNRDQGSDRWTVFRLNNFSHNTLTYNGKIHRADGCAKIVSFAGEPGNRTEIDLTDALGLPAGASARRVFQFNPKSLCVTITDTLSGLKPGDTIDWNMMTHAHANVQPEGVELTLAGKTLLVSLVSSAPCKPTASPADPPPTAHDAANPGITRINLRATAGKSGQLTITAAFRQAQ